MRAVLFDLDDTLFDHRHTSRAALATLQAQHACLARQSLDALESAHAAILERLHARVLRGAVTLDAARIERFTQLFREHGESLDAGTAMAVAGSYRDAYQASRRPVPGALELLRALEPHVRIGIVTNNLAAEQRDKLAHCGLSPLVDALVVSEEAGTVKPDAAIFRLALSRLKVDARQAVMVGDSWTLDVLGAKAAGLRAVWFNRLGASRPDPEIADEIQSLEPAAEAMRIIVAAG